MSDLPTTTAKIATTAAVKPTKMSKKKEEKQKEKQNNFPPRMKFFDGISMF